MNAAEAAGAIFPLVALLGSSCVWVQVQAAGALRYLAANADSKVKIKVRQRPFLPYPPVPWPSSYSSSLHDTRRLLGGSLRFKRRIMIMQGNA